MPDIIMLVDSAVTVPVNLFPLTDDTDFKTRETSVTYNQSGLELIWNFVTAAGAQTHTAVTPTDTGGNYDWVNIGHGMYNIEIPASGGASINNDTEGFGWFTGFATGILPWRGPVIQFSPANVVNSLVTGTDVLDVSVTQWLGTACHTPSTAGVPEVKEHDVTFPANFEHLAITDNTGLVSVGTNNDKTGYTTSTTADSSGTTTLLSRLSATRAGYLDQLEHIHDDTNNAYNNTQTLTSRLSSARAGYLDNLSGGAVALQTSVDDLEGRLTATRAGYLDNLSGGAVALQSSVDDLEGRLTATRAGYLDNLATAPPAASAIADAVWDEALSGHLTGGTTGAGLNAAGSAGDPWNTALPGAYSAGTAGKIIGDNVNATISSRSSHSAADVWASTTRILTAATNITSDGGTISQTQLGRLDAAISTRSTVTEAQVNAQCDTAISDAALATAANLTTVDGIVDSIKSVTDKVDGMVVLDGAVYRYTANALELAPSSSGGDATAANQTTIIGHLTDIKGATFSGSTDSLESIRDRGDAAWLTGGGGSGSNAISITVTDGTNPVQDVDVEIWDSGNTSFVTKNDTNASGVMTTNLNDGTYTVRMLKSGYTFTNRTLVVDGPETVSYSGSTVNIGTPSAPNVCRCYDYCMDLDGTPLTSVTATAQIMELPYDSGDELHIGTAVTGTYSSVTGLVYWDIVYGATVKFDIDEVGMTVKKVIPSSATGRITDMA